MERERQLVLSMEDLVYETNGHPMCIELYAQLCTVRGFQQANGYTYEGYVENWRARTSQPQATLARVGALNPALAKPSTEPPVKSADPA